MATGTVNDLRPNPRNPRKVTDKKLAMLAKALERFGDLGGIVFNRLSGQLVGGHQRLKALPPGGQVVLEEQHDAPLPNGTVASGYIDVAAPPGPQSLEFSRALTDLGVWRQTLVWVKNSLVMGHSDFHYRHEIIYYGWTPDGPHQAPADRKQDTVWEVPRPTKSKEHPTMKPLASSGTVADPKESP